MNGLHHLQHWLPVGVNFAVRLLIVTSTTPANSVTCPKVSKRQIRTETLSADGSPSHPKHPSTEGHHQT